MESTSEPEGFFDRFKEVVQIIGPVVTMVAPEVISTMLPVATDALKNQLSGPDNASNGALSSPLPRKIPSFAEMEAAKASGPVLEVSAIQSHSPINEDSIMPMSKPDKFKEPNSDGLIVTHNPNFYKELDPNGSINF